MVVVVVKVILVMVKVILILMVVVVVLVVMVVTITLVETSATRFKVLGSNQGSSTVAPSTISLPNIVP